MTEQSYLIISTTLILTCLLNQSDGAGCPKKRRLFTRAIPPSLSFFGGRGISQQCCVRNSQSLFTCQCASGLKCCRNFQNEFLCVDTTPRRGQLRGPQNRNNNENSPPLSGLLSSFFSNRNNGNNWVSGLVCQQNQCGPGGECGTVGGTVTCSCFSGFTLDRNAMRCVPVKRSSPRAKNKKRSSTSTTTTTTTTTTTQPTTTSLPTTAQAFLQSGVSIVPVDIPNGQSVSTNDERCISKCGTSAGCVISNEIAVCACNPGFVLDSLTGQCVVEPCTLNPCGTGEACFATGTGRTCACTEGFVNAPDGSCVVSPCIEKPCGQGEACFVNGLSRRCACNFGFVNNADGSCIANPCIPNPCRIGGQICTAADTGTAHCSCAPGFIISGDNCIEHDPCDPSPCGANSNCFKDVSTGSARCECQPGFLNSTLSGCIDDPCSPNPCQISGQICRVTDSGTANCSCAEDFVVSGNACVEFDPCSTKSCGADSTCIKNTDTGEATCECHVGFIRADNTCIANPCSPNPCGIKGTCTLDGLEKKCQCESDAILSNGICIEDPCEPNPCGIGGLCSTSESGLFNCSCSTNFILNENGACVSNIVPSNITDAPTKSGVNNTNVIDAVDPCAFSPCGPLVSCVRDNSTGAALCSCSNGKLVSPGGDCAIESVDLCTPNPCGNRGACTQVNSKVVCQCNVGFTLQADGTCAAIKDNVGSNPSNECPGSNPCGIGKCSVVSGQKVCTCPPGFSKANSTCTALPCDPATTPSTLEVGDASNSSIPIGTVTGCLKSRNYPQRYDPSLFDEVRLKTNGHTTLHIVIDHLETQPVQDTPFLKVNTCQADFLFAKGQLFCGFIAKHHKPAIRDIDVSDVDTVVIGFVSTLHDNFGGFLIRWSLST